MYVLQIFCYQILALKLESILAPCDKKVAQSTILSSLHVWGDLGTRFRHMMGIVAVFCEYCFVLKVDVNLDVSGST